MKPNASILITAMVLFATLANPGWLWAQNTRYKLIDLGTFRGTNSSPASPNFEIFPVRSLNNRGTFVGQADTSTKDPFKPVCFNDDCLVSHAFQWQNGVISDLGALTSRVSSSSAWVGNSGLIAGLSENGEIDPLISGFPEGRAVLWKNGKIIDLGTLEGGYESAANAVNSRGQVVGLALTTISEVTDGVDFSMAGLGYQTRAFLWEKGVMHDLGTLPGGTDAIAFAVNDRGQVMGQSYTADSAPATTPYCAFFPLSQHGFLWENGKMVDVGTLGGSCTFTYGFNNRGQVVGQSATPGDPTSHPFLWDRGTITDLGTLGGNYGWANWINDAGEIAGTASPDGKALIAFSWKNGVQTGLNALNGDPCSVGDAINSKGQVVGSSGSFDTGGFFSACETTFVEHAVLWENGTILDLNAFVPPDSDLSLVEASSINDRGEIAGFALLPNKKAPGEFDQRAFLLIPCGPQETEGCQDAAAGPAFRPAPAATKPANNQNKWIRRMLRRRFGPLYKAPVPSTSSEPSASGSAIGTPTAEEGAAKTGDLMPNSLDLLGVDPISHFATTSSCALYGRPCSPNGGYPRCCGTLKCEFHGGSTRVGYVCE